MGEQLDDQLAVARPREVTQATTRDTPWWALLVGVVFVVVVAATFSYIMSEDPAERAGPTTPSATADGFRDDFERPASGESLGSEGTVNWSSEKGVWGVQTGVAYIAFADTELNLATADLGSSTGSVSATFTGAGVCGVVARYSDPENYTALVRVTQFAVWNIVEVSGGDERVLGKVPDVTDNTVGVSLFVGPDVITATVGLRQTSVIEHSSLTGTQVGLIGEGEGAASCTWDNVAAAVAR